MSKIDSDINILLGICGTGGCAREVMPIAKEFLSLRFQTNADKNRIVFVEREPTEDRVNEVPVVSEDAFFSLSCEQRYFSIAIRESKIRERIALDFLQRGATPLSIHAPNSLNYDCNEIGEGAIICANSLITSNTRIGKFFHLDNFSYVTHDCVIGDFVTFAPRVSCNGNVHIGDHAYIGSAATLRQGSVEKPLVIGEGAIVGMGAVVTKDVPEFTTVVGNPAKPLIKNRNLQ